MAHHPSPEDIAYMEANIGDNRDDGLIASHVICFTAACIAVALRFTARRLGKVKYGTDDWLIVVGLVLTMGTMICNLLAVHYGLGRHIILAKSPVHMAQCILAAECLYSFAMMAIKFSILKLFHRIFFISRTFVVALWIIAFAVFGYSIASGVGVFFQCVPIQAMWNPAIKGRCINAQLAATILGVFNVATDFAILILPLPLLWNLHMANRQKLQTMAIFCLGGFVTFASIYRTAIIHTFSYSDASWTNAPTDTWTLVELGMAVVSACLPTYRALFTGLSGFTKRSTSYGTSTKKVTNNSSSDKSLTLQQSREDPVKSGAFSKLSSFGTRQDSVSELEKGRSRSDGSGHGF